MMRTCSWVFDGICKHGSAEAQWALAMTIATIKVIPLASSCIIDRGKTLIEATKLTSDVTNRIYLFPLFK